MILHKIVRLLSQRCCRTLSRIGGILLMMFACVGLTGCNVTLTVTEPEHGTVTVMPHAEDNSYVLGTKVQLVAAADDGYVFTGWRGASDSKAAEITLVMDWNKTVTATFKRGVTVELAKPEHGSFQVEPPVTSGTMVPFDTKFTITAVPDPGYQLDSIYKKMYVMEPGWSLYLDESYRSPHTVMTDVQDERFKLYGGGLDKYVIGAAFMAEDTWGELNETLDVPYAAPGKKTLKYDVYAPPGAINLPIVVIVHGGGWSLNNEDIMRGQARYIAQTGHYVVVSVDYRLTTDTDDTTPTKAEMVEDIYGAIAHIQENAVIYGGDPAKILITGDSAGAQLSASVVLLTPYIGSGGYTGEIGNSYFMPSYIPSGMSVDDVRHSIQSSIIGAALSYGVFDGRSIMDPAIEPISNIPQSTQRALPPQYLQVGSADKTVGVKTSQTYIEKLAAAGQPADLVIFEGAEHAYLDWKPEARVINTFNSDGKQAMDLMIEFFDKSVATATNERDE